MAEGVRQVLQRPIQLADEVIRLADDCQQPSSKTDFTELKAKVDRLRVLLRQAARADLYERPTRRIMHETVGVLEKAREIVSKSRTAHALKSIFTPATPAKKIFSPLDNCISNVSWLLRISSDDGDGYGLPPIALNEPILIQIWGPVAELQYGSLEKRTDAASMLASLAADNTRNWKLIIEEGAVPPLLKLLKEGKIEGQENAVKTLGLLARDQQSVEKLVQAGVCPIFAKILKDGSMKVQVEVARAITQLVETYPQCKHEFAENNVVRLLISHLAFETVQEPSKYSIPSKGPLSVHAVVMASNKNHQQSNGHFPKHPHLHMRESEKPEIKSAMKEMAAKALAALARGNHDICKTITDSRALLCFATLLQNGPDEVKYNSALALMEIAAVAETDADLRRSAFNPSAPAARAVVDQLLRVIESRDSDWMLHLCIKAIGCLSKTFRAKETRIIAPLVRLLDREGSWTREAVIALTKFACPDNYLHVEHSRAIINAGAAKPLAQLVYLGDLPEIKKEALILLCHIVRDVPESEALTESNDVISALKYAPKNVYNEEDDEVNKLLTEAKTRLEVYQSGDASGFR